MSSENVKGVPLYVLKRCMKNANLAANIVNVQAGREQKFRSDW